MSKPTPQQERVALRRSLYAPANARKNKLPTQAFLRAAEFGDLTAVRSLALEANAELSGLRCKNFLECDPHHLVDSAHYLNNTERKHLKYQFTELPELLNAVGTVQKLPPKLGHSASSPLDEGPKKRPETPLLAKTKGITGRLARSENNLTRLASTLAGRHHVSEAAKSQPQLLWEKARTGEQALPALARALRSERLAVKAAQMNPKLLRVSEPQIRKIMATLVSICGGAEQAAYAIVWRPELLELESAASLRESLQAASGFFGNLKDALFLLGQTTAPPSVKVIARQFCREYMVGEYFLVDGASVDDRPVWCKPAVQMKALGSRATDVYLIYCQKGVVGSDTMHPCWTFTTNYSSSLKKYDHCDPNILGWAESKVKSPDQLEAGDWHFPAEDHKTQVPGLWPADPYVRCDDGGRLRGAWLCTHAPRQLRDTFDMLRFATGLLWLTAESAESAELLGHLAKNDPVYSGLKKITFLDFADFAHIRRWTYLRLPATTVSGTVVSFTAWEPVEVCMLFTGETELEAQEVEVLHKGDFRVMPEDSVAKSFPTLEGAQVSKEVWARTYASGRFDLQVPLGPGGLPPLVFIRAHIAAHVLGKRPCHEVRLLAGEDIYLSEDAEPTAGELDATVLPKPKPVMYQFVSPGELGYTGYSLFKGPASSQHCQRSEIQMRVESLETLSVAMLLFPSPKVEVSTLEDMPPPPKADAKKRPSKSSRVGSKSSSKPEPPEPEKVIPKVETEVIIPSPPEWIAATGWHELPQKLYASVRATPESEKITGSHVYTRTVQPNEVLEVPGCGPDFFALFLFKQLSPTRPDLLRQLVMREPNLLTSGQQFNYFFSHLRVELGDPLARGIIMRDLTKVIAPKPPGPVGIATIWPKLCQNATEEDLRNWVYERKVEILERETGEAAPRILSHPDVAIIPAPDLQDRCQTLRSLMPGSSESSSLGDVLLQRRELLCCDVASLQGSFDTIQDHLGQEEAFKAAAEHSKLLTQHDELIHFFEVLNEKFSDFELRQLYDKAGREWVKWPSFVGKADEEIHSWQGRLMALFRHGRCQERVCHFGASAYGAAAVAQNSGVIPDIPPLID